jgi:hypothetical protein
MSTKLNAEELALEAAGHTSRHEAWRKGYATAIRTVAQPIADQRDELVALLYEVELLYPYTAGFDVLWDKVEAKLAKYPKP